MPLDSIASRCSGKTWASYSYTLALISLMWNLSQTRARDVKNLTAVSCSEVVPCLGRLTRMGWDIESNARPRVMELDFIAILPSCIDTRHCLSTLHDANQEHCSPGRSIIIYGAAIPRYVCLVALGRMSLMPSAEDQLLTSYDAFVAQDLSLTALDSIFDWHSDAWPPMVSDTRAAAAAAASPSEAGSSGISSITSEVTTCTSTPIPQWSGSLASLHVNATDPVTDSHLSLESTVQSYATDDEKWAAVLRRDPAATSFLYLVHSTRCYCRPSCPARRPKRENVMFIPNPPGGGELAALRIRVEMEKKGYKPCKRCSPDQEQTVSDRRQEVTVERAKDLIVGCIVEGGEVPKLEDLAREVGMSKFYFLRVFRKSTGETPDSYAKSVRKCEWTCNARENALMSVLRSALDDPVPAK